MRRIFRLTVLGVLALLAAGPAVAEDHRELTVATREVPPFAMRTDNGWDGIAIELWSQIGDNLGLRTRYQEVGLAEMLTAVESGKTDAAVAALTITAEREARLDFTHPFHTSGLGIAVRRQPSRGWLLVADRIFSERFLRALVPLLALLGTVGVLVWLVERRRNPQFQRDPLRGVGSGLWWSAVTMTTVGYGDKAPLTLAGRLIALVWMFASIIVISSITAAIATALTVGELKQTITDLDDLYRARVLTVPESTSASYLDGRLVRYRTAKDLTEALDKLEKGEADAVVYDMPILRYLVAEHYPQNLEVLPQVLQRQDYGIALPSGSPLREGINRELLAVIRSPQWQQLLERYLGKAP